LGETPTIYTAAEGFRLVDGRLDLIQGKAGTRNIDAVAVDVAVLDDDVAEVHPNATIADDSIACLVVIFMSNAQEVSPIRPANWAKLRTERRPYWRTAPKWAYSWLVFWSQQWSFLKVLDAAGKFVIIVAVVQWFLESGDRAKERHYRAWAIVNSARGAAGDGGRRDALQDLNADGVSLANAPLSNAYLIGVKLQRAVLSGATLSDTNLLEASLANAELFLADLTNANLARAQLQGARLDSAKLINANLIGANLNEAKLTSADLTGANLLGASLFKADLTGATVDGATFCGTLMPNGITNNTNCASQGPNPK